MTPATWIRHFIVTHPEYKHDSVVSEAINYDLLKAIDEMYVEPKFQAWFIHSD